MMILLPSMRMAYFGLFPRSLVITRNEASVRIRSTGTDQGNWRANATDEELALESWSQGFLVGSLVIMAAITIANMRRRVLLHKLVLLEQIMAMCHGTFCFMDFDGYGWYLSATATLLYLSWIVHNLVAWMKVKPFFVDRHSMFKRQTGIYVRNIYLSTLALTVPVIIFEIFNNFRFFNNIDNLYTRVRPYEPLFRDPWWVFTCLTLFHIIRKCYGAGFVELIRKSPRFGILLVAILLSMTFTAIDIAASSHNFIGTTDGINPWWKLSLVFKCLTDTIMLDDFKTELKRLGVIRIQKEEEKRSNVGLVMSDKDSSFDRDFEYVDALGPEPATNFDRYPSHNNHNNININAYNPHDHDNFNFANYNSRHNTATSPTITPATATATATATTPTTTTTTANDNSYNTAHMAMNTRYSNLNPTRTPAQPPPPRQRNGKGGKIISDLPGLTYTPSPPPAAAAAPPPPPPITRTTSTVSTTSTTGAVPFGFESIKPGKKTKPDHGDDNDHDNDHDNDSNNQDDGGSGSGGKDEEKR